MTLCARQQFAITVKSNRGWIPRRKPTPYINVMGWYMTKRIRHLLTRDTETSACPIGLIGRKCSEVLFLGLTMSIS